MISGLSHVKYDHFHFPRKVELKCPTCDQKSFAENKNVPGNFPHFIDISGYEKVWEFSCLTCIKREKMTWEELSKIRLWNKISIKNEVVWAWNINHLEMILKKLRGENIDSHDWAFFANYLNKNWLKNIRKKADFTKIESFLSESK